ncbi:MULTISPECIES: ABC transporter substrate-binding protein [Actinomyces]|uniref:Sugar ABC transporter substrate-binding protein n=1 Tax=Actinomyces respiraculi TaxID=2744574 RepID=A0A7T0LKD7_9ACTO|nr:MULTISPECIES: sugar ABC transporter substrate-binding protein [Actinomyces]QPL05051.1 sugar ABC transporter substrate-binding protein [Actinomyces respiraculi]
MKIDRRMFLRATSAVAVAGVASAALAACGSSGSGTTKADPSAAAAAAEEGGELLVWAWDNTIPACAEAFMKKYPNVKVEVVNVGTSQDQYTSLQNAISAGKGGPDVAQVEYYALPQFSISEALADLSAFGAGDLNSTFTEGPWGSVTDGDAVYGLPLDSGPMAMFYNEEVFTSLGIAIPTTWDEYLEAARAIHAADPTTYIANDTGDAGSTLSGLWQAGATPYTVDGTKVTIDFSGAKVDRYADFLTTMIKEGLVAPISGWTDEWFQALGDGTIATLVTGAWMPGNFISSVPDAAGKWRVAPQPRWDANTPACAENGGSSLAAMAATDKQALAYQFIRFCCAEDGIRIRIDGGAFPSTVAELDSADFLNKEFDYFGGQKANEVLSQAAKDVLPGWSYLPFQIYANSVFNDNVGVAYTSKGQTSVAEGLAAWQKACITYGNQQGFTVS